MKMTGNPARVMFLAAAKKLGGVTATECETTLGIKYQTVSTLITRMVRCKILIDTGKKRTTLDPNGKESRPQVVYVLREGATYADLAFANTRGKAPVSGLDAADSEILSTGRAIVSKWGKIGPTAKKNLTVEMMTVLANLSKAAERRAS
jgi:hypothetical protein